MILNYKHTINNLSIPPVKLYADISAAALRTKQTNTLALWHCLRALPSVKAGNITGRSITDVAGQLSVYGYSLSRTIHLLYEANGLFWRVCEQRGRTTIKIYGLLTVLRQLGITRFTLDRHARIVEAGKFSSCQKRNSQFYASIFKPEGQIANPITRETITAITGLSLTQQRRYEKLAGVGIKRTPNYEMERAPNGGLTPVIIQVPGKTKLYSVPRRLGNIYHTQQGSGCKGQLGKARLVRGVKAPLSSEGVLPLTKLFFTSLRRIVRYFKGTNRERQGYILVSNKDRCIRGRMEWQFYHTTALPLFKGESNVF